MARKLFSNSITLPAPLLANTPDPVDARYIVENHNDLLDAETFGTSGDYTFVHPGMKVYACDNRCVYTYIGPFDNYGVPSSGITSEENWRKEIEMSDIPSPEGDILSLKAEVNAVEQAVFGHETDSATTAVTEFYADDKNLSGCTTVVGVDHKLSSMIDDLVESASHIEDNFVNLRVEVGKSQKAIFGQDVGKDFDNVSELYADDYILSGISNMVLIDKALSKEINDTNLVVSSAFNDLNNRLNALSGDACTKEELVAGLVQKQDVLESGVSIKTINNESLLGGGDITIESGNKRVIVKITSRGDNYTADKTFAEIFDAVASGDTVVARYGGSYFNLTELTDLAAHFSVFGDASDTLEVFVIDSSGVYAEAKTYQRELTSGENIKTINGQSILGSGDMEIGGDTLSAGTSIEIVNGVISAVVDDEMLSGSVNPVQNGVLFNAIQDNNKVISASLNDLNTRLEETEDNIAEINAAIMDLESLFNAKVAELTARIEALEQNS